jgi:hypothetical protein
MKRAVLLAALLAACTPIYEVPEVAERNASDVAGCEDLGRVRGIPGVFGPLKDIGLKDARRAAKEKAKEVGGNTVVFDPIPEGEDVFELQAQVYAC